MKFVTGAFIVLLCVTVSLIISFKRISAETTITPHFKHQQATQRAVTIGSIPLPAGFTRVPANAGSFAEWLRSVGLRKNNTVYLYNGQPVERQELHYAVLDISTGAKDLQQCADAIMRLRAEYYFSKQEYDSIVFGDGNNKYSFSKYLSNIEATKDQHGLLLSFMETVFINCGTYTVDAMSKYVPLNSMQPGDMFVKAGAPGHAMIVADMAENAAGEKIYLLAQGYMPAQDMHIVINPANTILSPWYKVMNYDKIITPGWMFDKDQLKRWK